MKLTSQSTALQPPTRWKVTTFNLDTNYYTHPTPNYGHIGLFFIGLADSIWRAVLETKKLILSSQHAKIYCNFKLDISGYWKPRDFPFIFIGTLNRKGWTESVAMGMKWQLQLFETGTSKNGFFIYFYPIWISLSFTFDLRIFCEFNLKLPSITISVSLLWNCSEALKVNYF